MEEISEKAATGATAAIYAEIRSGLGVPMVNLIYRRMAALPGSLEWAWSTVEPSARSGALRQEADAVIGGMNLGAVQVLSTQSLRAVDIGEEALTTIVGVVDAYNRSNPMNVIAAKMILQALDADRSAPPRATSSQTPSPAITPALPPLIDVAAAAPDIQDVLRRLARQASGGSEELIPTLYRHFGDWPGFLGLAADIIEPFVRDGGLAFAADIEQAAGHAAHRLLAAQEEQPAGIAAPTGSVKDGLSSMLKIFPGTICGMIVIGGLLHSALPPRK